MNDLKKIFIVARYTFAEIYKSRVLMNVVLLGIALVVMSFVASEFTFGVPQKVALDFGLGTLSLSAVAIAIFMGVSLLSREIENRTVYMILSRPIRRYAFLLGRVVGMGGILFLNILILSILTISLFLFMGGEFSSLLIWSIFFSFLEAMIVLLIVLFFSLVTNNTMSVIYSFAIYVVGHSLSETVMFSSTRNNPFFSGIVKIASILFPNFSKINVKGFILYQQSLPLDYLAWSSFYALIYIMILLISCTVIFERKNLD